MNSIKCNNCGKLGHLYYQCKVPITSVGVIAVRRNRQHGQLEYLMIRRKDTLGYIDIMRGKYSIFNRPYILNMLNQMTVEEKTRMRSGDFNLLWQAIWGKPPLPPAVVAKGSVVLEAAVDVNQYRSEELTSRDKYKLLFDGMTVHQHRFDGGGRWKEGPTTSAAAAAETYTLNDLIDQSDPGWSEPEWGFPKGRRNPQESDYECALREFTEETGVSAHLHLQNIQNLMPYEEIFTGSNYKSYKHKYYVMLLNHDQYDIALDTFETSEVSLVSWKTVEEARQCIRPYNLEKLRILDHVDRTMKKFPIMVTKSCLSLI